METNGPHARDSRKDLLHLVDGGEIQPEYPDLQPLCLGISDQFGLIDIEAALLFPVGKAAGQGDRTDGLFQGDLIGGR